jgi:hypothetical protein
MWQSLWQSFKSRVQKHLKHQSVQRVLRLCNEFDLAGFAVLFLSGAMEQSQQTKRPAEAGL